MRIKLSEHHSAAVWSVSVHLTQPVSCNYSYPVCLYWSAICSVAQLNKYVTCLLSHTSIPDKENCVVGMLSPNRGKGGVQAIIFQYMYIYSVSGATFLFFSSLLHISYYAYIPTCFGSFAILRYLFLLKLLNCPSSLILLHARCRVPFS
jgi:hypothetical protein